MLAGVIVLSWITVSPAATFKDALGRTVTLNTPPKRIVSMAPSLTEILYYLGLEDRIAGVTQFSYYPPEAAQKPNVGSYINLNAERIVSLNPDLAIGTKDGNKPTTVRLLEQAGIPVYIVNPRNIEHVISTVYQIGELCGVGKRAKELSTRLGISADEASRVDMYASYWFWLHWGQYASSTSDEDINELENLVNTFYRFPFMQACWELSPAAKPILDPKFVAFVDNVLADKPH